ncbi:uncharacterized protein At1g01500-like [Aristolochia californica]|uniref:uncharacterized protein At1g01500-like n=1 Tax=Aristolochia californica TaxID=171875 RepID=UPI0035DF0316
MDCSCEPANTDEAANTGWKSIKHSNYQSKMSSWFDMRVFYVRISNCDIDESTPEFLTLNHIPLCPAILLEVNRGRSNLYSDSVSSLLRRDRVGRKSKEATFVSTDNIRMTGSVRFEVYFREHLLLSGVLERSNSHGFSESKTHSKRWCMNCQPVMTVGSGFFPGKPNTTSSELHSPTVEVYVAGCFSGNPIILTKTLQLNSRRKLLRKNTLDSIPEYETAETKTFVHSKLALQVSEFRDYKQEKDDGDDYNLFSGAEYTESEDGELSWFNAGVRVGVGIGLGICLGIGIGVGLLARTYQATTQNFKRRLV